MEDAMKKHPDATVLVNFASLRSAYDSTVEAMTFPQIRCIAIIAEGIPENLTRKLLKLADSTGVTIIGPATVKKFIFSRHFWIINVSGFDLGRWIEAGMF